MFRITGIFILKAWKISSNYKNYGGFAINSFTFHYASGTYLFTIGSDIHQNWTDASHRLVFTDRKQSEFLFFYVDKDVADIKVNIKANSNQIDEILTQALTGTGLTYTINDRNINIMRKAYARQQQAKQITGKS